MPKASLYCGDALTVLRTLPTANVQCCITSPPYWGLRDYGTPGQLGLERTPDEYVERLGEVFREVRRVLRDDGTLWLNMGDSYNSGTQFNHGSPGSMGAYGEWRGTWPGHRPMVSGLKPKDLVGIPWMVAKALQAPSYTGRIKSVEDRIWLAAMLDAEGCMFIHKRKAGQSNGQGYQRQNDTYSPGLEISNTSERVVQRCLEIAKQGSICHQDGFGRKQRLYRWNLRTTESRELVRELYPYLVGKQQQARILYGCPTSGDKAEAAHQALIDLHRGIATSVDFAEPPSCFEPGWYLRSEIIWAKSNPMPESVQDRPTRSHEQVFLLSKAEKYFYDQVATYEPHSRPWWHESAGAKYMTPQEGRNDGGKRQGNGDPAGRNARSVWTIGTQPYSEAHFATFPEALVLPCLLAGTSAHGACGACGAPWRRVVERGENTGKSGNGKYAHSHIALRADALRHSGRIEETATLTTGWHSTCVCSSNILRPCVTLDPFGGSGTVAAVSVGNGRDSIYIDNNSAYLALAEQRIGPMYCHRQEASYDHS